MFTRRVGAVAAMALTTLILTGCGAPPWETTGSTTAPTTSSTPRPTISTEVNELASGNAVHSIAAGDVALTATYWSTLGMDQWKTSAQKPLSFSISGALGTDDGQQVYLSRVSLAAEVTGPDGPLESPQTITDTSTITPGYLIKAPYSYSQTFIIPAVDPAATSIVFTLTYEILVQATPTSAEYAKQTAVDTLTVTVVPETLPDDEG